jgi:hypothetical protein
MTDVSMAEDRLRVLLPILVALLTCATVLAKGTGVLSDPDPYWHIVAGRWIIDHRAIPDHDFFSHSVAGAPWVAHEWLAQVATAWLYDHFGWNGLIVATALAFAAAMALLARALLRYLAPEQAFIGVVAAWGMCFPHLLARPHVFALPLLVVWGAGLVAARAENRAPSPFLALAMVVWANLHGGYMLGLALVVLFAGEALFDAPDRRAAIRAARDWGLFGALSLAAALVTPNGIAGLLLPLTLTRMEFSLSYLNEWRSPDFQQAQPLEAWLMLVLLAVLFFGVRLPITRIAMLLLFLHMALQHRRHGENLGILAPLLVAPALAPQLARYKEWRAAITRRFAGFTTPLIATGIVLACVLVVAAAARPLRADFARDSGRFAPAAALAAAARHQVTGPVLNDLNFGSYLIFAGVKPFVDGRADVYGDAFIKRYSKVDELPNMLAQYRITWTLFAPNSARTVLMDHLAGWRRIYADDIAVVHVRETAPAQ